MVESAKELKDSSHADSMLEFKTRFTQAVEESEIFAAKFNREGAYLALTFQDGSLQLISPMLGDKLFRIKNDRMVHPITRLCWKPVFHKEDEIGTQFQNLYGSCIDGSVVIWDHNKPHEVEHRTFNEKN